MATVTKADRALIAVLGPFKVEIIQVTAVTDGDTVVSKLQNPTWAHYLPDGDLGGAAWEGSASISGKTVTLHDPNVITTGVVLVFGDGLS